MDGPQVQRRMYRHFCLVDKSNTVLVSQPRGVGTFHQVAKPKGPGFICHHRIGRAAR